MPFKNQYMIDLIGQLLLTILALIGLAIIKKMDVIKFRFKGLGHGFAAGGILIVFNVLILISFTIQHDPITASHAKIVMYAFHMLLIGIFEEILFRGILQNVAIDYTGCDTPRVASKGILLAGILFGCVHMINIVAGASIIPVLLQAIAVIPLGCLMGAVYFRSNNLWSGILLHALIDAAGLSGMLTGASTTAQVDKLGESPLIRVVSIVMYICITLFVMRRSKMEKAIEERKNA